MRALQIMAPGHAEVIEVPLPEPEPDEVRVKVVAINTCPQWDLHLDAGEPMFPGQTLNYPYTVGQPGHEMTGVVDAVGADVAGFRVGQRVAAWKDAGHHRQGCYAEYVCHQADHLLAAPADLDPLQMASLELAMCVAVAVLTLRRCGTIAGRRAAVNGLGPAGLIAAQLLRAEGASMVIGLEPSEGRRNYAVDRGLVNSAHDPGAAETDELYPHRTRRAARIDVAVDCCGYPAAVRYLMDRVASQVALFAVQRHDYVYAPEHAGLLLLGYEGHRKEAAQYALERIVAGELDLRPLVSAELPLERYAEGVARLRSQEAIKICFRP